MPIELKLPKVIWIVWLQGWEQAPRLVRACRRTWELNNPDWTIHCLDRRSVMAFIDDDAVLAVIEDHDKTPQNHAEAIRLALLKRHGGVWADATTYCLRPLDDWVHGALTSGFFAFANPIPGRVVSTWFLVATLDSYIIQKWLEITLKYWEGRQQAHDYFWLNLIFAAEFEKNPAFRRVWDETPKQSAVGPAYYHPKDGPLWLPVTDRDRQVVTGIELPLLKLYHRLPPGEYPPGSVAEFLCERLGN